MGLFVEICGSLFVSDVVTHWLEMSHVVCHRLDMWSLIGGYVVTIGRRCGTHWLDM